MRTRTLLKVDEALARTVAGETLADVRTVRRVMRGESVRGVIGAIIQAALERRATAARESQAVEP